jgi:probable F420-dependent oxidoreductase
MEGHAMLIDGTLPPDLTGVTDEARAGEALGYDGLWVAEVANDPFLPLALAAAATQRVTLGTSIAVAFARNPMTVAMAAGDLHRLAGGRFVLGLGSQIKPHITKRFSMPWTRPAARMREFVLALRAIFAAWNEQEPLRFEGEFYTHTLMTPFFAQAPNPHGAPPIFLAAVGPAMTRVAGEVADGLFIHPFTTRRYLEQVTVPGITAALADAGRRREDFTVSLPGLVVTGRDESEMSAARDAVRLQLAFYASTPSYRPVLEAHGWDGAQDELNRLSKQGEWGQMAAVIDDEMLATLAVVAEPQDLAAAIAQRYGDIVDRFGFSMLGAHRMSGDALRPVVAALQRT